MRKLNKKQKEILKNWLKDYLKKECSSKENQRITIYNIMECLDYEVYESVRLINDFETINQAIENFISEVLE